MSTELAWAAGFFDGEGCFSPRGKGHVILQLIQSDPRPLLRFAKAFRGVVELEIRGPFEPKGLSKKQFYTMRTSGGKAARVYAALEPYLSEPKKEQYQRCLDQML